MSELPSDLSSPEERAREGFLFPKAAAPDDATFPEIVFNANLQEFSQRVSFICALESNGKLPSKEAYDQIKALWKQLQRSEIDILHYQLPDLPPEPSDP